ncbi:MAG: helix-turn-helix domain-containing protein [Gammaproteobacteria bacterium]
MHPADIKAALKKNGKSQSVLAKELGVSPAAVHLVIEGRTHSKRVAKAISQITGYSIDELWPEQYEEKAA